MSDSDVSILERVPSARDESNTSASKLRRLVEWFWRSAALRQARQEAPPEPDEARELRRRARLAAEGGRRALEPSSPFRDGQAAALACDLYRQSLYWRLASLHSATATGEESADLRALWERADRAVLLGAAGNAEHLAVLEDTLVEWDFVRFATLSADEQFRIAWQARTFVEALLDAGEQKWFRIEQLLYQRTLRVLGAVLGIVLICLTASFVHDALERRREISGGKEWRTSSREYSSCTSPAQRCRSNFFFHTKEQDNPWVRLDLGAEVTFSGVRIDNRSDCCRERALPLVVEVSTDGKSFREVARRTQDFESWKAEFEPVAARFVRARVARKSYLHLRRFTVLR